MLNVLLKALRALSERLLKPLRRRKENSLSGKSISQPKETKSNSEMED